FFCGPWPRDCLIEDRRPRGVATGRALQLRNLITPHQIRYEREHHRRFVLSTMNFRKLGRCAALKPNGGIEHAHIKPEASSALLSQRFWDSRVPAVAIDYS